MVLTGKSIVDFPRKVKKTESFLSTVMPYLPMESVKVISPFLELTFTAPTGTILVESYTLPVNQTWEKPVEPIKSSSTGKINFNMMEGCFRSCKYKTAAFKFGQQWPKEMLIQTQ